MKKRLCAFLLAAVFVLLVPTMAMAAEDVATEGLVSGELVLEEVQELDAAPQTATEDVAAQAEQAPVQEAAHVGESVGSVTVRVINNTYTDGAPWTGEKLSVSVPIYEDSTMLNVATDALKLNNVPFVFQSEYGGYISEVDGLHQGMGSAYGGWMMLLNDWFTDSGAGDYTVANGKLQDGDTVSVLYTLDYGNDLGGDFYSNDKTVKNISVSVGKLSPAFDKEKHSYYLEVPEGTESVVVTPTASNKNFQVRVNDVQRIAAIEIEHDDNIVVKCGDPEWPTMNADMGASEVPAETYNLRIKVGDRANEYEGPDAVKNLKAASAGYNSIKLSWSKAVDNEDTMYTVYRSTSKVGGYKKVGNGAVTGYTDAGLKTGTAYYYKVKAYVKNDMPEGEDVISVTSGVVSAKPVLPKVTGMKALAVKNGAKLSWGKSAGASAYTVYRSEKQTTGFKAIKATKAGSYTDNSLKSGKVYYYKIVAYRYVDGKKITSSAAGPVAVRAK